MFLVDASKEMFIKGEDGQPSNFDLTMQVGPRITLLCILKCLGEPPSYRIKWKLDYSDSDFKLCFQCSVCKFSNRMLLLTQTTL